MSVCIDLTIAIPVRNEEKNLAGCLQAIGSDFAQRIVVIDSGSTDMTRQIAYEFGADIIDFKWDGKFPKKRNWFLRQHTPQTKWVLFLDADEYITDDFKTALSKAIINEDKAGYWLNYTIYFLGKPLRGGYPLRKLALFQAGAGEYEEIEEEQWSGLDMEIHEHLLLKGKAGVIFNKIDHRDFNGIAHYVTKHNEYSSWEANRYLKAVIKEQSIQHWTWAQKLKYRLARSPLLGIIYFLGSYILMGGFLDGSRGLAFAILKMSYFTQVSAKIKEKNQSNFKII